MNTNTYANAKDVLPANLLITVQQHYTGILWIPTSKRSYQERNKLIVDLRRHGACSREIGILTGLTTRRVNQILMGKRTTGYSSAN